MADGGDLYVVDFMCGELAAFFIEWVKWRIRTNTHEIQTRKEGPEGERRGK